MKNTIPTVLFATESSFLSSGYATYTREVMKRLYKMGKFNLVEMGSFGQYNDPRALNFPWKYISTVPNPNSKEEQARYESNIGNKYGAWKFEEICLETKPDIIFSIRDWWADSFIFSSPFRDFYHYSHMPTVDATPLMSQWVASYMEADSIFTYTDWGLEELKRQTGNKAKTISSAPPGADVDVFKPLENKSSIKQGLGLPPDSLIIGTVMRNMKRKLYPDIIQVFEKFLKEAPEEIRNKTYLYLHTSYPDCGWDIPRLLKDYRVGHRTLFTYHCKICKKSYPSTFQDAISFCKNCLNKGLVLPGSGDGVERHELAQIMGIFDIYLQLAQNEGFGMPLVEAASCGVPVLATDYSAMYDVVRKLKGIPIKVLKLQREAETYRQYAIPDLDDLYKQIIKQLMQPSCLLKHSGHIAREAVLEHYTYDRTAKILADHFESVELKDKDKTWNSPSRIFKPSLDIPENLSDDDFIKHCFIKILNRPDKIDSYTATRLSKDLHWLCTTGGMGGIAWNDASALGIEQIETKRGKFDRNEVIKLLVNTAEEFLYWEQKRLDAR